MKLHVDCRRCGGPLEVEPQMVANAVALGQELELEHAPGQCPGENGVAAEEKPLRRFRLQIMAVELPPVGSEEYEQLGVPEREAGSAVRWSADWQLGPGVGGRPLELMAGIGHTVTARNFPEAVNGDLTRWLNDAWPRFQESSAFADLPPSGPVPKPERVEHHIPVEVVPAAPSRLIIPGRS